MNEKKNRNRQAIKDGVIDLIRSGELKPGERLVQQQLAKQFGVGQGLVRESLLELTGCGLVDVVDNAGMFVGEFDQNQMTDVFEIREFLEGLAARLCCRRVSREEIQELRELVEEIYRLGSEEKFDEASLLDRQFHQKMIQIAGNRMLNRLSDGYRVLGSVLKMSWDNEVVYNAHCRIIDAISDNDPDAAEQSAREHVASAKMEIERNQSLLAENQKGLA